MTETTAVPSVKPPSTLRRRFKLNVLSYGYAQVVTLAVQLLLVPFFLKYWGTERYANWLVLTGIPTMLTLLDLGVAQALANRATMQAGAGKRDDATSSLQTALAFTLCLCAVVLLLACTVGLWIDWTSLLRLATITTDDASLIVVLMAGYLCAGLMGGPLDAWFRTIDRTPAGAFMLANRRMLDVVISVTALALGAGPVTLAAWLLGGQIIAMVGLYVLAIHWSPWPIFGLRAASWTVFKATLKPAVGYMGFPIAQVVTLQGGLQVLNQVASPSVVVAFTMARTLMRLIIQAGVVANNALKPEISRLAGQGKLAEAKQFSDKTSRWILGACFVMYCVLLFVGPSVIELWGHSKVSMQWNELSLIGLHALANVAWFISASMLIATNRHTVLAFCYGVASCVTLIVWWLMANWISPIAGISLVLLIPEVLAYLIAKIIRIKYGI